MKRPHFPTVFGKLALAFIFNLALVVQVHGGKNSRLGDTPPSAPLTPESFKNPPAAAKPMIWWFWSESVTTERGITQDLESMKRVGYKPSDRLLPSGLLAPVVLRAVLA